MCGRTYRQLRASARYSAATLPVVTEREKRPGVAAWSAFLMAHAASVRRIERELETERGLPLAWYDVLLEVNAAPRRRLRMQDLSDRVVLSRSRVSRVVDAMAAHGLVRRQTDPSGRRASFAVLTDSGRRTLRRSAPIYLPGIEEHFTRHLTADELRVVQQAMDKIRMANEARRRQPLERRDGET